MALEHESESPLARAVRAVGSQSALARVLGINQSTVYDWLKYDRPLPTGPSYGPNYVFVVERETGISRHELRPDLYQAEPAVPLPAYHDGARR